MASSSSNSWHVFLSFKGEDTRHGFTDYLCRTLVNRGIRTFRDERLQRGEEIAPALLRTIEESRLSIVVLSENYADSKWCLNELAKIMECKKKYGQIVVPVFYHVDPSDVRHQTGSFGKAFAKYERDRRDPEELRWWRDALNKVAGISGWPISDRSEFEEIQKISRNIYHRLNCRLFDVGENLVGTDDRVKTIMRMLDMESNDTRIVGIHGLGGIGKTTLAKAIYNHLCCDFEHMSLLENVREVRNTQNLLHLQTQLLRDILGREENQDISNLGQGINQIKTSLRSKRVFIVLDDVDSYYQLEHLLENRDWLGEGSKVIITTRNEHLLAFLSVDDIYEVEILKFQEALELFSRYALRKKLPLEGFTDLSHRAVNYCQGLPLALKVLGSFFYKKTTQQWESGLDRLATEPPDDIYKALKRSFDGLSCSERNIFLDVACFFQCPEKRDLVVRLLDACNFHAEIGSQNLKDECLVSTRDGLMDMHDMIKEMGRQFVRRDFDFANEPDRWTRSWEPSAIQRALVTNEGIRRLEILSLELCKFKRNLDCQKDCKVDYKADWKEDCKTDCNADYKMDCKVDYKMDCKANCKTNCKTDYKRNCKTDYKADCNTDYKADYKVDCKMDDKANDEMNCKADCQMDCKEDCQMDCKADYKANNELEGLRRPTVGKTIRRTTRRTTRQIVRWTTKQTKKWTARGTAK